MAPQREWIDQDFYQVLGVAQTASAEEIKKAYRRLARELHPDSNPGDTAAEDRFKRVSEAHGVLSDSTKRKEYDDVRRLAGSGRFRGSPGGFTGGASDFNIGDIFGGGAQPGGSGGIGDIFGGLFNRSSPRQSAPRTRRGEDLEAETSLTFVEAALGTTTPLNLTGPAPCTACHGSGAKPGTSPRVCPGCNGAGAVSRQQGSFGFSEPCGQCSGTGSKIEDPCTECVGSGVKVRTRTIKVRIPAGVEAGQRIRLAGQGEAGLRGAPAGDLYITCSVDAHKLFTRVGNDIKITIPVRFSEIVLGTTISVPTLDGSVGVKIPPYTSDGRILRVRGKGVAKAGGVNGDLLVTVKICVPTELDENTAKALDAYATAEKASGFDPRRDWGVD